MNLDPDLMSQVTPFILRRTKDAVLKDLPPKILQDVYCSLSPLQAALYEEFSASQASRELENNLTGKESQGGAEEAAPHVFQVLSQRPCLPQS